MCFCISFPIHICIECLIINFMFSATRRESGFHHSTRLCLEQIREALLHHRWQEATEYISCYSQILEDTNFGSAQKDKEVGLLAFENFYALEVLKEN